MIGPLLSIFFLVTEALQAVQESGVLTRAWLAHSSPLRVAQTTLAIKVKASCISVKGDNCHDPDVRDKPTAVEMPLV
ncbi:hypothetical protein NY486_06820, partial [Enterobacter hormaechei]|nr:hypothetical protein [Enterobacter hormaechei]